ncbi:hypothetical protein MTBLM1_10515 [Rhodospirillaceae bacterium LM-1]|nr:hypothetical protein MTBLM1_10515 [Rhodospirillaceae bacterium LM-1]
MYPGGWGVGDFPEKMWRMGLAPSMGIDSRALAVWYHNTASKFFSIFRLGALTGGVKSPYCRSFAPSGALIRTGP